MVLGVMVDLETLSIKSDAVIVSIGAVEFDTTLGKLGREFNSEINIESGMASGLKIDAPTLLWWLQQSDEARNVFKGNKQMAHLASALQIFSSWYPTKEVKGKRVGIELWGNGANFDNVVLANAYKSVGLTAPWPFWNDRCYRTLKNLYPDVKCKDYGVAHNALDDAKKQALHLIEIFQAKSIDI